MAAHRAVAMLCFPEEFRKYPQVNHKCHNKLCINPEHLYCGTQQDNIRDNFETGKFANREKAIVWEKGTKLKKIQGRKKKKMPSQSSVTVVVGFRIFKFQEAALKIIPSCFKSRSDLLRALIQLYLDGKIPELLPPVINPQDSKVA